MEQLWVRPLAGGLALAVGLPLVPCYRGAALLLREDNGFLMFLQLLGLVLMALVVVVTALVVAVAVTVAAGGARARLLGLLSGGFASAIGLTFLVSGSGGAFALAAGTGAVAGAAQVALLASPPAARVYGPLVGAA